MRRRTTLARAARLTGALVALVALAGLVPGPSPVIAAEDPSRGEGAYQGDEARVAARLVVDHEVAAPGSTVQVGVLFELESGWHMYWRNPGQSGLPTELAWQLDGGSVGPIAWPAPGVFREADGFITTYGYADEVLLAQPAVFEPGPAERRIAVEADFLVCEVQCIPGSIHLERTIRVAQAAVPASSSEVTLFDRWAQRIPVPSSALGLRLEAFYSQSAIRPGDEFRAAIAVEPHGLASRDGARAFVPDRVPQITLEVTGARAHPFAEHGGFVTLAGRADPEAPQGDARLRGVLAVRTPQGVRHAEVDLPLARADAGAEVASLDAPWFEPEPPPGADLALWRAALLALIGGVILNGMPCVLPVLAIKIFGVTELAQQHPGLVRAHGLAYTAGILVTMLGLAAGVVALRAAGTAVGWGFQFQEPLFVAAISALLLVFALNLFGVFEVSLDVTRAAGVGGESSGLRRSFFEGLLAVVVATPCTAPFLGTAVGFAFAGSTAVIVTIFAAIGVGLAAPYLLIALVPGWARWLPRSGPWMLQLRRVLGFALLATIVWLVWVFGRSTGVDGMTALLGLLVSIGFLTTLFGSFQYAGRRRAMLAAAVTGLVLAAGGGALLPSAGVVEASTGGGQLGAVPFDPARVEQVVASGRPAFVWFTADWCLTCKVNEGAVLTSSRVSEALDRLEFGVFRADWTRRDETIRRELESFGRAGVPLYLVYPAGAPDAPRLLPELLTVDLLVDALEHAARAGTPVQTAQP